MEKYLYLTKKEWQQSWVHGGGIPINLASTYLRQERGGIYTPDETLVHKSPIDIRSFAPAIVISGPDITVTDNTYNGMKLPEVRNAAYYREDGIILSFCNVARREISERMGKACCVKILDVFALKEVIDAQLGIEGIVGPCQYTKDHQRNHFLKSIEDVWQQEYRMFWRARESKQVTLPAGIAVPIDIY